MSITETSTKISNLKKDLKFPLNFSKKLTFTHLSPSWCLSADDFQSKVAVLVSDGWKAALKVLRLRLYVESLLSPSRTGSIKVLRHGILLRWFCASRSPWWLGCGCGFRRCRNFRVNNAQLADLRADPLFAKAALGVAVRDFSDDVIAADLPGVWSALLVPPSDTFWRTFTPPTPLAVIRQRLSRRFKHRLRLGLVDGVEVVSSFVIFIAIEIVFKRIGFRFKRSLLCRPIFHHQLRIRRRIKVRQVSRQEKILLNVAETTGVPIKRLFVPIIALLHDFHHQPILIVHAPPPFAVVIVVFIVGHIRIVEVFGDLLLLFVEVVLGFVGGGIVGGCWVVFFDVMLFWLRFFATEKKSKKIKADQVNKILKESNRLFVTLQLNDLKGSEKII